MNAQTSQPKTHKAARFYSVCAANLFSAVSVWAAYLGTTRNPLAFLLALGLAAGATLLFRYGRRGPGAQEPVFAIVTMPILWGLFVVRGVVDVFLGRLISQPAWTAVGILSLILALDLWLNRRKKV